MKKNASKFRFLPHWIWLASFTPLSHGKARFAQIDFLRYLWKDCKKIQEIETISSHKEILLLLFVGLGGLF